MNVTEVSLARVAVVAVTTLIADISIADEFNQLAGNISASLREIQPMLRRR